MTKEQMIELIATKVHGWGSNQKAYFNDETNQYLINKSKYDPLTNIAQAIEAVKKFCKDHNINRWELEFFLDKFICRISSSTDIDEDMGVGQSKNEAEAICNALIEAIGERKWK